jgi:hypothetical protein
VGTPTGYMCKECINQRKKKFDTAVWYDYLIGFGVTFLLSLIASAIVVFISSIIPFYGFFLAIAAAGSAGILISNITLRAIAKRRSKPLFMACAIGVVIGAIPISLFLLLTGNVFSLIAILIYIVITTPLVYTRVSGIQL